MGEHLMPEPIVRTPCRVIYGDTDSGGFVYYGNYLRYFERARTEFLREHGLSYRELEEQGFILPVIECYSRYKAPAHFDDLVIVETSLVEVKPIKCRFNYRIYREGEDRLLVKGHTVHAVIDRKGKLTKLPKDFLDTLMRILKRSA